jgi:hypothetical protein
MPYLLTVALLALMGSADSPSPQSKLDRLNQRLRFEENKGQWNNESRFLARSPGLDAWVTQDGVVYDFYKMVGDRPNPFERPRTPQSLPKQERVGHVVRLRFEGASPGSTATGKSRLRGYSNYLKPGLGETATFVSQYASAQVSEIYPGVSLRLYQDDETKAPRYDVVLAPGADLSKVRMRYDGASNLRVLRNGQVAYDTSIGTVVERGLTAFETDASGVKQTVPVAPKVENGALRYLVPERRPGSTLVIDPIVYSTYIGGRDWDAPYGIAVHEGRAIAVGYTYSTDFPTTPGAYRRNSSGYYDAYVFKLNADGSNLEFSTYLGGMDYEFASGVAVDALGSAYVTGYTYSQDFPTKSAYQSTLAGGSDAFVTKLKPDGSGIVYSTYLGGSSYDSGYGIALDNKNRAYVCGSTSSTDFPTFSAVQATIGGESDAFVTRLGPSGAVLTYSSYLGGSNGESATGIKVDASYRAVLTGNTYSSDFPTVNPYQATIAGGQEVFVTKVASNGSSWLYSTYVGGANYDYASSLSLDTNNAIYVAGYSYSTDFPASYTFGTAPYLGYVLKLSSTGSTLVYSDRFANLIIAGLAVDANGRAVFSGYANGDMEPTPGAYQIKSGGMTDSFLVRLAGNGSTRQYASYLGGSDSDAGQALALDAVGNAYIAGYTNSYDFPMKFGGYDTQASYYSLAQGFVTKFSILPSQLTIDPIPAFFAGQPVTLTVRIPSPAPAGGVLVHMNGGGGVLELPNTLTIPENETYATITIETNGVDVLSVIGFNAQIPGTSATRKTTAYKAAIDRLVFNPVSVLGGSATNVVGRVILNGKAGPSGLKVFLNRKFTPGWSAVASIPDSVTIAPNAIQASFNVTHQAPTENTTMTVNAFAEGRVLESRLFIRKSQ